MGDTGLFAAALLALLGASSARADAAGSCPVPGAISDEMLSKMSLVTPVTNPLGPWNDTGRMQWIDDHTFEGPYGMKFDRSCLSYAGIAYPSVPTAFVEAVRKMHDTVQKCGASRALPSTIDAIRAQVASTTLSCSPTACTADRFEACAVRPSSIVYRSTAHFPAPDVLFHESLHLLRTFDNQNVDKHNSENVSWRDDTVYFFEAHCFAQDQLLSGMRGDLLLKLKTSGMTLDSERAYRDFRRAALEACLAPLNHGDVGATNPGYDASFKASLCTPYADYLTLELRIREAARRDILPKVLACAGAGCPPAEAFDVHSDLGARLARGGIVLPPQGAPTAEALAAWTQQACALTAGESAESAPAGTAWACAIRINNSLGEPEVRARLAREGVTSEQLASVARYVAGLAARAHAAMNGPERYVAFAGKDAAANREMIAKGAEECARPELRDTDLCRALSPGSPVMNNLDRLASFWAPRP